MKRKALYLLLAITAHFSFVFGQTESIKIFLFPKDNFIPIKKEEIKVINNTYYSKLYNFSIGIPQVVKTVPSSGLPNNCIFEINNEYSNFGFWISQYSKMYYTKEYSKKIMKFSKAFKELYSKKLFEEPAFKGSTIIDDNINTLDISGIPSFQYKCHFIKRTPDKEYNGQIIITQLFYKKFNYRIVCTYDYTSPKKDVVLYLNDFLVSSFKILNTND